VTSCGREFGRSKQPPAPTPGPQSTDLRGQHAGHGRPGWHWQAVDSATVHLATVPLGRRSPDQENQEQHKQNGERWFDFAHTTAFRKIYPDAWMANAARHGTPIRFFAGSGAGLRPSGSRRSPAIPPVVS
jgi:hypothetical protein